MCSSFSQLALSPLLKSRAQVHFQSVPSSRSQWGCGHGASRAEGRGYTRKMKLPPPLSLEINSENHWEYVRWGVAPMRTNDPEKSEDLACAHPLNLRFRMCSGLSEEVAPRVKREGARCFWRGFKRLCPGVAS